MGARSICGYLAKCLIKSNLLFLCLLYYLFTVYFLVYLFPINLRFNLLFGYCLFGDAYIRFSENAVGAETG